MRSHPAFPLLILALLALALAACGGPNTPRGLSFDENGGRLETPTAEKDRTIQILAQQITKGLETPWQAQASIAENPEWDPIAEKFLWKQATIVITVGGPADATLPTAEPEIATAVADFMKSRMAKGKQPIIAVNRVATVSERLYTVRAGDTLVKISVAYFGSEDAWPAIADANPTIDSAAPLVPGTLLKIPADP